MDGARDDPGSKRGAVLRGQLDHEAADLSRARLEIALFAALRHADRGGAASDLGDRDQLTALLHPHGEPGSAVELYRLNCDPATSIALVPAPVRPAVVHAEGRP